jgi:hypothetical protein
VRARAFVVVCAVSLAVAAPAGAAHAAPHIPRILLYGPSLTTQLPLNEATIAQRAGFEVRIASAEKWASLTTKDFAVYDALVVGDPDCEGEAPETYLDAVEASREAWTPAVTGPAIVIGSDPMYHQRREGAVDLTRNAILYAASGDTTGMYFSLSCHWSRARSGTTLDVLDGFGSFQVLGQGRGGFPGCPDSLHVSAPDHPAMEGLTDRLLSNWGCSAHEAIDVYPEDWVKLVGETRSHEAVVVARSATV